MSPTPSTPASDHRPVRGARSCTLCRQMKARCNATEMYPDPCSRCAHLGKAACVIEPSFRRVNKRARIAEIQHELEELKQTVQKRSGSMNSRASSEYSDTQGQLHPPEAPQNNSYSPGPSPFPSPFTHDEDPFRSAGVVGRVDFQTEDDLFMTYFNKFHPTLPIVDHTLSPAHAFSSCPLLYHTILLLATLATPNHPLTWSLTQTVTNATPQHVVTSHKSVHLVQAFLLLATWPQGIPQGSTVNDQAWMYVGIATHMAQCLGLHRSFLSAEYNQVDPNEDTRRDSVRTWIGCFIVGQFLSTALGVNPIIAEDFTILNAPALLSPTASSSYDPALSLLLDKVKMARVGARITGLLSSCPNSSSGLAEVGDNLAIFRILQGDVQEVEASLLNPDEARGLSFLWVKTQLYSYALYDGMLPQSARTEFILRGCEASLNFLEAFAAIVERTPLCLMAALHPFSAVCSWTFVLKTLFSRYRVYLDISSTEKILVDIQRIMTRQSVTRGDFSWKTGVYMDTLFQDAKAREYVVSEPFLGVRSRMAAGLYFDGLARLAEIRRSDNIVYETKVAVTPPSTSLSNLSSPLLSSDDMSTPPTSRMPTFHHEKPIFTDYWNENHGGHSFAPETKVDMDWLADSFLLGESGVPPAELSVYGVAPGLLMVQ